MTPQELELRNKEIQKFKDWVGDSHYSGFKNHHNEFAPSPDGFIITPNNGVINKIDVNTIDEYCHVTNNFTWQILTHHTNGMPTFEIICYY